MEDQCFAEQELWKRSWPRSTSWCPLWRNALAKGGDLGRVASVCPPSVSPVGVVGFAGNKPAGERSDGAAGQTPSSENLKVQTV